MDATPIKTEVFQFMKNVLLTLTMILGLMFSSAVFAQDADNTSKTTSTVSFSTDKGTLISYYELLQKIREERNGMRDEYPLFKRLWTKVKGGDDGKELKRISKTYRKVNSKYKQAMDDLISNTTNHPATVLLTLAQIYVDAANSVTTDQKDMMTDFYDYKALYDDYKNPISFKIKQQVYYELKGTPKAERVYIDPSEIDNMVQEAIDRGYDGLLKCSFDVSVDEKNKPVTTGISYDVTSSNSSDRMTKQTKKEKVVNTDDKKDKKNKKEKVNKEENSNVEESSTFSDGTNAVVVKLKGSKIEEVTFNGNAVTAISNDGTTFSGISDLGAVDVSVGTDKAVTVKVNGTAFDKSSAASNNTQVNTNVSTNVVNTNTNVVNTNTNTNTNANTNTNTNTNTTTTNVSPTPGMNFASADGKITANLTIKGDEIVKVLIGTETIDAMLSESKSFMGTNSNGDIVDIKIDDAGAITFKVGETVMVKK
jgi:hypothetical protein